MANETVETFFDALSADYTATIERCFPRYREMLWALLTYLPRTEQKFERILELGCGTGNFSVLLCQAFPAAAIDFVDISGESLDVCRSRLDNSGSRQFVQNDFRQLDFDDTQFDLIVSSISIHHIDTSEKQRLFEKCFRWLRPGGVLSFADQFRGVTEDIYQQHIEVWKQQSFAAGGTEEEFEMWMQHQQECDYHDTLAEHFSWLSAAGFSDIDSVWRYSLWSVVQARKP